MGELLAIEFNVNNGKEVIRLADAGDHLDMTRSDENEVISVTSLSWDDVIQLREALTCMIEHNVKS